MFEYVREVLLALEENPAVRGRADAIAGLRRLGLDDFGEVLLSMPNAVYPKLSHLLPAMASDEVQLNWTGNSGVGLLKQTTNFVRALSYNYTRITGRPLDGKTVLDFGCGYGRIARLLYYFTDEQSFWGVDPLDRSIELCRESGLDTNFLISDFLPESLPLGDRKFDLIYAFSVFTHLSRRATTTALRTLRRYVTEDGVLAITIRPVEYWQHDPHTTPEQQRELEKSHRESGFAFMPHNRAPIDGDITYGDTSMTLEWLERNCPEWALCATDRSLEDPWQRYLFLEPS
jgi:SAM-dependent methyltransferase